MMKNSKLRRILLLLACAVLLVSLSVGATLAYLTSTDEVENTFTVGDVKIKLDEAPVNKETGKAKEDEERTTEGNTEVRMVPGRLIDKDPTVTVEKGSEDCYVRVKVIVTVPGWEAAKDDTGTEGGSGTGEDSGAAGEPAGESFDAWASKFETDYILYNDGNTTKEGFDRNNWAVKEPVSDADGHTITYVLTYKGSEAENGIVAKNTKEEAGTVLEPIFNHIHVPAKLGNTDLAKLAGMSIKVVAEAIQAEGFTASGDMTAEMKAWEAFDNPN